MVQKTNFKEETLRTVLMSVLERDLKGLKNKKVLEIGCGNWPFAKDILEKNGCTWHGIDPVDFGKDNMSSIKGSVQNIPFHDNTFDVILSIQSIEHWFEYGVSFRRALNEIHRVTKKSGVVMINGPIYLHGHPYFLRGDYKRIANLFNKRLWKIDVMESCFPSVKVEGWKKITRKGFFKHVQYPSFLIPKNAKSHIINIHLSKKSKKPKKPFIKPVWRRHAAVIVRFVKELVLYRF